MLTAKWMSWTSAHLTSPGSYSLLHPCMSNPPSCSQILNDHSQANVLVVFIQRHTARCPTPAHQSFIAMSAISMPRYIMSFSTNTEGRLLVSFRQSFKFSKLPPEIRNKIWGLVLNEHVNISMIYYRSDLRAAQRPSRSPVMLGINKETRAMAQAYYKCYFKSIRSSYLLCPSDFPCLNMWLSEPAGYTTVPPEYAVYFNKDVTTVYFDIDALIQMDEVIHEQEFAAITSLVVYCLKDFRSWFHLFDMWDRIDLCSNLRTLTICCGNWRIAEEVVFELYDGLMLPEEVFNFNQNEPIELAIVSCDGSYSLKGKIENGQLYEDSGAVVGKMV